MTIEPFTTLGFIYWWRSGAPYAFGSDAASVRRELTIFDYFLFFCFLEVRVGKRGGVGLRGSGGGGGGGCSWLKFDAVDCTEEDVIL